MHEAGAGWSVRPFADFCHEFKRINTEDRDLEPLSVTKSAGIVRQSDKFTKRIATDTSKYKIVRKGEFAYDPMSLYYGAIGRLDCLEEGVVSPAYITFDVDDSIDRDWFRHLVHSDIGLRAFIANTQGGNLHGKRKKTDWPAFRAVTLPTPPLAEQRKIAAILSSVDAAIEANEAVIEQTRRVKEGMLQELMSCGVGHPRFKPTAAGGPSAKWEVVNVEDVARRGSGHTPSKSHPEYWNGEIKWVSLADSHRLDQVYISETDKQITPAGIAHSSAVLHPAGTVLVSRDASVGRSAISLCEMAVSQHFIAWQCGPRLDNHFFYYFLQHHKSQFERIAVGSTIKTIGLGYFKSLRMPLPPLPEQERYARALLAHDEAAEAARANVRALNTVKSGLLQDLLTGKVRVSA